MLGQCSDVQYRAWQTKGYKKQSRASPGSAPSCPKLRTLFPQPQWLCLPAAQCQGYARERGTAPLHSVFL